MNAVTEPTPGARFSASERRLLLSEPGIGPQVIARLESAGIGSLQHLQHLGVDKAVLHVCQALDATGWANRRRALCRALSRGLSRAPNHAPHRETPRLPPSSPSSPSPR